MFAIEYSKNFQKQYQKITKNNSVLEKRIDLALIKLESKPEGISHKVGDFWSARVTGDIRIIWQYKNKELVLLLLKIGGHSGANKVY